RSARRLLQRALDGEARLRAMIETAPDGVLVIDSSGTVRSFNRACEQMFGYAADEVVGHSLHMLMPARLHEAHDEGMRRHIETGQGRIVGRRLEVPARHRDGSEFEVGLSVGEVRVGGEVLFIGIIADVSERKAAERALKSSEAQFRAVVETAVDGVILIDDEARILSFNPASSRIFGYGPEEVMGRAASLLVPPEHRAVFHQMFEDYKHNLGAAESGRVRQAKGLRKDGSQFPAELSLGHTYQGERLVVVGVVRDITERIEAEHERTALAERFHRAQKLDAVGRLAGGIAHDFNNILGAIMGYAAMLTEDLPEDAEEHRFAAQILQASRRGADLVRQLLTFSRQSGDSQAAPLDPAALAREVSGLLRAALPAAIRLEVTGETGEHWIRADATQIQQVLMNLCVNARDAIGEGSGHIDVALDVAEPAPPPTGTIRREGDETVLWLDAPARGPQVRITVRDDGGGIPPHVIERMFEPFFTTKPPGHGSGLGLAAVHGIVSDLGGAVEVRSRPGHGTSFAVYLPAVPPVEAEAGESEAGDGGSERVLFVDDEPALTMLAREALGRLGYRVSTFNDGAAALEALRGDRQGFDVVVTDQLMPDGTGMALLQEIRELREDLPVLICTGFSEGLDEAMVTANGGQGLLYKPLTGPELDRALRKVLGPAASQPPQAATAR
ncbi:MAG TPA: PAS domain S-box protein, partial [Alphaproteobacteria bacterium]|nr:PAS domain S-box protein [Alphaproteobacteria bacterium]